MAHPFQSESVGTIFKALAAAQKEIQNPVKNAKNPHFKSTYTTLDEGLNVIREALSAVEIAVFQRTYMTDSFLCWKRFWITVPYKPQDGLSALTYARRGALFAAVGIAGEDDDGNAANKATVIGTKTTKIDENTSSALLAEMINGLGMCKNEEELTVWTLSNKSAKANLTLADQAIITRTYKQVMESIKEKNNG